MSYTWVHVGFVWIKYSCMNSTNDSNNTKQLLKYISKWLQIYPFDELCLLACSMPLVFWREWQIYGCFMLFYVPEASAFLQLTGSLKAACHISQCLSALLTVCCIIIHSEFDSWMPICDLWDTRLMCTYTWNGLNLDVVPASTFGWLIKPKQSSYFLQCGHTYTVRLRFEV